MHQSTTTSLSQTIWLRWTSREFLRLPIVQTLLPVTFGYSLSSDAVFMRQLRRWKRLWWMLIDTIIQEDIYGAFQKLLERYNKCIAAGGLLRRGLEFHVCTMCTINKSAHTKKSLETYLMILVHWNRKFFGITNKYSVDNCTKIISKRVAYWW